MLKKAREFLKLFIFVDLGAAMGRSIAMYSHYKKYPKFYEIRSTPWYTELVARLLVTALVVAVAFTAYVIIGRIIKKREIPEKQ